MAAKDLNFKYRTSFASAVRCLTHEDTDKFLAIASLDQLKKIIPDRFFSEDKRDLFPIASNLAVINMANANDDAISTEIAIKIYKSLIDKYLNAEHKRKNHTIGHIINSGFSKFNLNYKEGIGSDLLTEEQAAKEVGPFNICYSAIIYKLVAPELIDLVVDSNNPESANYLSVSSSWEIGFNEYSIVLSPTRYLSDATEIIKYSDEKFAEYDKLIKSNGGSGKIKDSFVFRLLDSDPIFLGAALTTNPAASVAGTVFGQEKDEVESEKAQLSPASQNLESPGGYGEHPISQLNENTVIPINEPYTMDKISNISEISDESIKKISKASVIIDFLNEQIKSANDTYKADRDSQVKIATDLAAQKAIIESTAAEAKEKADKLEKELGDLKATIAAKAAEDTFNQRMAHFDNEFELEADDRKILVTDLKDMSDESFASYKSKMEILLKGKNKKALAAIKISSASANTVVSPTVETPQNTETVVSDAIKGASAQGAIVPNTNASTQSEDLFSRFDKAFVVDDNVVNTRKNRNGKQ